VTLQCITGSRGRTEPVDENCPANRGASSQGRACAELAPAPVAVPLVVAPPPQANPLPEDPAVEWDYETPAKWKTLPGQGQCGGGRQSPIDINRHAHIPRAGANVQPNYNPTRLTALVNTGHALRTDGQFGVLQTPRGVYTAQRVSFHFPSEHTLDGVNADGEMHIVHTMNNNPNFLAIIAVPLKVGRPLSYQFDALHAIGLYNYPDDSRLKPGERKALTSTLNLQEALKPQLKGDFYTYDGSLTAPPCKETVTWYVSAVPMSVGWRMPTDFNLEFGKFGNNRPTQPTNGRPLRVQRFLPPGAFVPEADPPDDAPQPQMQAPPQNNDDVLTGDAAEQEAEDAGDDESACEPGTWCRFQGKDGSVLQDAEGDDLSADSEEEAMNFCLKEDNCIAIASEDGAAWFVMETVEGEGPFKGKMRPDEILDDDDAPEVADGLPVPEGEAGPPPIADAGGPPDEEQQCNICKGRLAQNGAPAYGFCGTTGQCVYGTREVTEPVDENCGQRGSSSQGRPCGDLGAP
jgi:carbonic anhydrase